MTTEASGSFSGARRPPHLLALLDPRRRTGASAWSSSSTVWASTAAAMTTSSRGSSARATPCTRVDHRGHGRSDGPRALIEDMDDVVADVDTLVDRAVAAEPGVPVFMLGHSMGGLIALRYALAHQERLAGLILSAALAQLDAVPKPLELVGRALSVIAPRAPLIAIDSALVSRDPAVVEAYRSDPLVHHGKVPARTAVQLADAVERFPETVRRDHRADAHPLRHRRRALPSGGQRDAGRADRRRRQDRHGLRGPLPRDPQRARARDGARRHRRAGWRAAAAGLGARGPRTPAAAPAARSCRRRRRSRRRGAATRRRASGPLEHGGLGQHLGLRGGRRQGAGLDDAGEHRRSRCAGPAGGGQGGRRRRSSCGARSRWWPRRRWSARR